MMFGKFFYEKMNDANSSLTPLFYFPYIIIFYFIVLSFFSAIIMHTYNSLRQKKQLVTEAMAKIFASETRKQKAIWLNLLCCRIQHISDNLEFTDSSDDDDDKKKKPEKTLDGGFENFFKENSNNSEERRDPSLQTKIKYNLNQIKNSVRGNLFKTREKFEDQLNKAKMEIRRRQKKEKDKRYQIFKNPTEKQNLENYGKLTDSIIYFIYIVVMVVMILYQTRHFSS